MRLNTPGARDDSAIREERCFLAITGRELQRLAKIAAADRLTFFAKHPRWARLYADGVLCSALCQGAALHYVDLKNGIKDWDVWTFYRLHRDGAFPPRRRGKAEFGDPRFGRSLTRSKYVGRCVDLIGRAIEAGADEDPAEAVRRYLRSRRTRSARCLAEKAVVLLEPVDRRGDVVWPVSSNR